MLLLLLQGKPGDVSICSGCVEIKRKIWNIYYFSIIILAHFRLHRPPGHLWQVFPSEWGWSSLQKRRCHVYKTGWPQPQNVRQKLNHDIFNELFSYILRFNSNFAQLLDKKNIFMDFNNWHALPKLLFIHPWFIFSDTATKISQCTIILGFHIHLMERATWRCGSTWRPILACILIERLFVQWYAIVETMVLQLLNKHWKYLKNNLTNGSIFQYSALIIKFDYLACLASPYINTFRK